MALSTKLVNDGACGVHLWQLTICSGFVVQLVPTVVQQLTRFRLTQHIACPFAVAELLVLVLAEQLVQCVCMPVFLCIQIVSFQLNDLWHRYLYSRHTSLTTLFSGTARVSRYQKGKTNLDFTEARDSEWQWHQLGHMQACTLLQTDSHASTPPLSFLQAGCPFCRPTNSVKALKAKGVAEWIGSIYSISLKFQSQDHRSKFTVPGEKMILIGWCDLQWVSFSYRHY